MKLRFFLKEPPAKSGTRLVVFQYSHASKRWRGGTGLACEKKQDWDSRRQCFRISAKDGRAKNQILERKREQIAAAAHACILRGVDPTPDEVRRQIESTRHTGAGFWAAVELFEAGKIGSVKTARSNLWKVLRQNLSEFERQDGPIRFDGIGQAWIGRFWAFCIAGGNRDSTVAAKLRKLRTFLSCVDSEGIHPVRITWDIPKTEPKERVYLTDTDIAKLKRAKLSPMLRDAADRLLFMCYTGLRASDVQAISSGVVSGDTLTIRQEKTKTPVVVYLPAEAREILHRIGAPYQGPIHARMKKACRVAGISDIVLIDGQQVEKWRAVSPHTGRRTFATNMLLRGVPMNVVSRAMGHRSVRSTMAYDRSGHDEAIEAIRRAWSGSDETQED